MKLKFTKMHGAGNDFIVIDAINQNISFTPEQWKHLADRRFGIGADQILVVSRFKFTRDEVLETQLSSRNGRAP